jgi:hypothetical protein
MEDLEVMFECLSQIAPRIALGLGEALVPLSLDQREIVLWILVKLVRAAPVAAWDALAAHPELFSFSVDVDIRHFQRLVPGEDLYDEDVLQVITTVDCFSNMLDLATALRDAEKVAAIDFVMCRIVSTVAFLMRFRSNIRQVPRLRSFSCFDAAMTRHFGPKRYFERRLQLITKSEP